MFKTILHATDLKENHFDLCQKAVEIAQCHQAKLYLLHVIEIPISLQWAQGLGFAELATPSKEGAQAVINTIGEALNIPREHLIVEIGTAYSHIVEKAMDLACDLIILGNNVNDSFPAIMGSTVSAVMHHTDRNILTLRTTEL